MNIFIAKSPVTGEIRSWEALNELGNDKPFAIISADNGEREEYPPNSKEYNQLYREYIKQ
jgi:hypothetical protein